MKRALSKADEEFLREAAVRIRTRVILMQVRRAVRCQLPDLDLIRAAYLDIIECANLTIPERVEEIRKIMDATGGLRNLRERSGQKGPEN